MKRQATITVKNEKETIIDKVLMEEKNKKLNYLEQDTTNVFFDQEKKLLIRENKEIYMELSFQEEKGILYQKELGKTLNLKLKTIKIIILNNKIEIQYEIENERYFYKIEMEA